MGETDTDETPWHRPRWKWAAAAVVVLLATPKGRQVLAAGVGIPLGIVSVPTTNAWAELVGLGLSVALYVVVAVVAGTLVTRKIRERRSTAGSA